MSVSAPEPASGREYMNKLLPIVDRCAGSLSVPRCAKDPPKQSPLVNALEACRAIADPTQRLACYDKEAGALLDRDPNGRCRGGRPGRGPQGAQVAVRLFHAEDPLLLGRQHSRRGVRYARIDDQEGKRPRLRQVSDRDRRGQCRLGNHGDLRHHAGAASRRQNLDQARAVGQLYVADRQAIEGSRASASADAQIVPARRSASRLAAASA